MSGVWWFLVPVAIVALLFVLQAVRRVGRSVGTLVQSMQELSEVGIGISKLRDELAAQRAASDDVPPQ